MSSQFTGYTTADVYQSVINDVIDGVKEAFLDEGLDIDLVQQLKKSWEETTEKMMYCEQKPKKPYLLPPPKRSAVPVARITLGAPPSRLQYPVATVRRTEPVDELPQPQQYAQAQYLYSGNMSQYATYQPLSPAVGVLPTQGQNYHPLQLQPNQYHPGQHVMYVQTGPMNDQSMMPPEEGSHFPDSPMYQMDGNGDRVYEKYNCKNNSEQKSHRKDAEKVIAGILKTLQLDGGYGAGMSDSSSEDEDDDPLHRLANRVGGDGAIEEETEEIVEDTPLNSDDDEDGEDLEKLFDVDNVMICQFEKVHRARNKWKLHLKDGVMRVDRRDYCFHKATGEAEF